MVPTATPSGLERRPLLFIANYEIRKRKRSRWASREGATAPMPPHGSKGKHTPAARPAEPDAPTTIEKALRIPFQSWGGSAHYAMFRFRRNVTRTGLVLSRSEGARDEQTASEKALHSRAEGGHPEAAPGGQGLGV
jgi:hypothetical protein